VHDAARAKYARLGSHDVTGKLERPDKPEPTPIGDDQSFGEALKKMGFLPVPGAKRRIIRQERPSNPLSNWKKTRERNRDGT
jgi:hypothetical protein